MPGVLKAIWRAIRRLYDNAPGWWDDFRRFFEDAGESGAWYGEPISWLLDVLVSVVSRIWDVLNLQADYQSFAFVMKAFMLLLLAIGVLSGMAARDRNPGPTKEKDEDVKGEEKPWYRLP